MQLRCPRQSSRTANVRQDKTIQYNILRIHIYCAEYVLLVLDDGICLSFNPLMGRYLYVHIKQCEVGILAVGGWTVTFGTAMRGLPAGPQPAQVPPFTKCNNPPINGQCTNHRIAV